MAINLEQNFPELYQEKVNTARAGAITAATGAYNFDYSASTGTFKTSTGAHTLGGNVTISGAGTFTAGTGAIRLDLGAVTQKANVISGQGATAALTAAQSGSVVLFDRAAGIVYTLPAPAVGMYYDFIVTTTITTNNAKVITDAGTTLIQGDVRILSAGTPNDFAGNGTTHVAVTQNGTTTGGVLGSRVRLTCVTSTVWQADGLIVGSGIAATPFAIS